jgi:hypothetical protein
MALWGSCQDGQLHHALVFNGIFKNLFEKDPLTSFLFIPR